MNRKFLSIIVAVSFLFSAHAQSRGVAVAENPMANAVATPAPATETIQTTGKKSSGNNNAGKMLGQAAMGITAAGVAVTCVIAANSKCKWFIAGLAASVLVTKLMGKAKKESDATVAAVTTGAAQNADGTYNASTDYNTTPEWQAAQNAMNSLRAQGYSIDENTGVVTDPSGKKFSADTFSSNASMSAAGMNASDIQMINSEKAKLMAAIDAKVKAADGTDMYGEDLGGGGAGKSASAGSADGGLAGVNANFAGSANVGLGIDRDPAQVAGMTKNLGGEPIGVSGDSLFKMIDRRYDLHNKQGSFLTGP